MQQVLTIAAPAKVNLAMSVGGLEDGSSMHSMCSWMVTVDFHDDLQVLRLEAGSLSRYAVLWHDDAPVKSDIDWSIRDDLAVRAHLAMEHRIGRSLPLQLTLRKRIPVGGGLGGGSADAAAMLLACRELFELHQEVDNEDLMEIASNLGSDVPFMLHGGSAIVEGLGEQIEQHAGLPSMHLVLILPGIVCPTRAVYQRFDDASQPSLRPDDVRALVQGIGAPFNDLAAAAKTESAELDHLISAIEKVAERTVHVSGSGSTLFLLCDTKLESEALATAVAGHFDIPTRTATPIFSTLQAESNTP